MMQLPSRSKFRCTRPSSKKRKRRIQLSSRLNNSWLKSVRMARSPRNMNLSNSSSHLNIRSPCLKMRSASIRMISNCFKRIKTVQWLTLLSNLIAKLSSWLSSIRLKSSWRSQRSMWRLRKWNCSTTRFNHWSQRLAPWRHNSRRRTPQVQRWRLRSRSWKWLWETLSKCRVTLKTSRKRMRRPWMIAKCYPPSLRRNRRRERTCITSLKKWRVQSGYSAESDLWVIMSLREKNRNITLLKLSMSSQSHSWVKIRISISLTQSLTRTQHRNRSSKRLKGWSRVQSMASTCVSLLMVKPVQEKLTLSRDQLSFLESPLEPSMKCSKF